MDYLATTISKPLEREYEAWIVHQIRQYFKGLAIPVSVFGVSPNDETTWPADEVIAAGSKIVGLQFKRPKLTMPCAPNDFSRLHWDLSSPPNQLQLLIGHSEIYYCLPTFINRLVQDEALGHCLFWRPDDGQDHQVWYDNRRPQVRTGHSRVCGAPRWGFFAEQFLRCHIGHILQGAFSEYMRSLEATDDHPADTAIQVLLLPTDPLNPNPIRE